EVFGDVILESEAVMITRADAAPEGLETFTRRLQGVLVARSYVMMDYDIRAEDVDAATAVAPGLESPTVSPLHRQGWVAVRVMVQRAEAQRLMDQLWEVGARAILTTDIHACRI
ncbi:MAG TPA: ATP phosphoribosyltransferase, partial [Kribbella sp.]